MIPEDVENGCVYRLGTKRSCTGGERSEDAAPSTISTAQPDGATDLPGTAKAFRHHALSIFLDCGSYRNSYCARQIAYAITRPRGSRQRKCQHQQQHWDQSCDDLHGTTNISRATPQYQEDPAKYHWFVIGPARAAVQRMRPRELSDSPAYPTLRNRPELPNDTDASQPMAMTRHRTRCQT